MNLESRLCRPIHRNGSYPASSFGSPLALEPAPSPFGAAVTHKNKSSGLHILKAPPPLAIPTRTGMLLIPQLPFEEAIELINTFFETQTEKNSQFENSAVAWITHKKKEFTYYPPAFESRGLSLKQMLFLESNFPSKTLHSVCEENLFQAIVVVGKRSRTAEHIAKKWLKPRDGPEVHKADDMEKQESERLVIFIE